MNNKKTLVNVACSVIVLLTNTLIAFWLSPYIVANIGVEANGFVTLANNFVVYAQLIVTALNSMAARFIAISYKQKDFQKAQLYYNSVFWGNLVIVAVLIIPAIVLIARLEYLVDIPVALILQVKILFSFVFFNFFLTTALPNWDCGAFCVNRLDKDYIPQALNAIVRCAFLFIVFSIFVPKVYFVGIAATIMAASNLLAKAYNTHKLTPELKVFLSKKTRVCSLDALKELVTTGVWNSVSSVGTMLLSGLDLLICNVFLGATAMGVLSLSKLFQTYLSQFSSALRTPFLPELILNYASGDMSAVTKSLKQSMKLTGCFLSVMLAGILVLGEAFFSLWVPTQDAHQLQILAILSICSFFFTSGCQVLFNVFTVVNKVKINAIAILISGFVSCAITVALLIWTELDLFAVAGVSSVVNLLRNMFFMLPVAAHYLQQKWYVFYPQVLQGVVSVLMITLVGMCIKSIVSVDTWFMLFVAAFLVGSMGIALNFFIMLNKNERKKLAQMIINKLCHTKP